MILVSRGFTPSTPTSLPAPGADFVEFASFGGPATTAARTVTFVSGPADAVDCVLWIQGADRNWTRGVPARLARFSPWQVGGTSDGPQRIAGYANIPRLVAITLPGISGNFAGPPPPYPSATYPAVLQGALVLALGFAKVVPAGQYNFDVGVE